MIFMMISFTLNALSGLKIQGKEEWFIDHCWLPTTLHHGHRSLFTDEHANENFAASGPRRLASTTESEYKQILIGFH